MLESPVGRMASAAALILAACSAAPAVAQGDLDGVLLRGGGSSFAAPMFQGWIGAFAKVEPGLSVDYDSIGSGEGMSRFVTGSLDFAGTDAPLPPTDAAQVEGGALQLPLAGGMVAICYNIPGFSGELRLPREVYAGIFDGTITEWNDERIAAANPGLELPKRTIAIVVRRDGSGTTFAVTNHLTAIDPTWQKQGQGAAIRVDWPGRAMTARGNEGVAATILQSEYSIGYVEYGFAQRLQLPMALLENKDGEFVAPGLAAGRAAFAAQAGEAKDDLVQFVSDPAGPEAYPLVTLTWALVKQRYADQRKSAAVKAFLGWGLGEGQAIGEQLGYVTLSADLASAAQASLATIE